MKKLSLTVMAVLLALMMVFPSSAAPRLNKKSITIRKNKTYTIKVRGTKARARWKTSKRSVVKLVRKKKSSVKIKAVRPGKAVISARIGKKTYKCRITVVDPKLSKVNLKLNAGDTYRLKVSQGTGKIKWQSSNSQIATVTNGKVTAKRAGVANITAVQNKKKLTCKVVVVNKTTNTQDETGSDESKPAEKKRRWVETKPARTVYTPVYDEYPYIECLTCGEIFEGDNRISNYTVHSNMHMDAGERSAYTAGIRRIWVRDEQTHYPAEGYWVWE